MSENPEGTVLMEGPMGALKDARRVLESAGIHAQLMQPEGGCKPGS